MTLPERLAERCEKATGPDRELDRAIGDVSGWLCVMDTCPRYTASLDAAMTLVPEGWSPIPLLNEAIGGAWRATSDHGTSFPRLFRERLPAFLCAAALRARSQTPGGEGE